MQLIGQRGQTGQAVVRAIGPSLTNVPDALVDPTLDLFNAEGTLAAQNDDWADTNGAAIETTGLAPSDSHESGVGLVEVYHLP